MRATQMHWITLAIDRMWTGLTPVSDAASSSKYSTEYRDQPGVLVTGGAGFIGSHTVVALIARGYRVVVLDNFCNSHGDVLARIEAIVGSDVPLVRGDVRDSDLIAATLRLHGLTSVMHFAAFKSVAESCVRPLEYYDNNVGGTIALLAAMRRSGVSKLVFSSTAAVYDASTPSPIDESAPLKPASPYGRTKLAMERLINDVASSDKNFHAACLRYFNPVGAHPSGTLGELPLGLPNNLMPSICHVAAGRLPKLKIFGDDYPTHDGTGVRDYLHVVDLARAHVDALDLITCESRSVTLNLGTGKGTSVLELLSAFERVNAVVVPREILCRRPGDVAVLFADPTAAMRLLGWTARMNLETMCHDAWQGRSKHSAGLEPQL